ncbi:MAG: hypothetical protein NDI61_13310, partial [Bdellovibrionaceae bacterium]|nr:hypothetical protein [Pseudobdellovibrionaceae bacterium]
LAGSTTAQAQTFKVLKMKGNKAVIQLPKGSTLEKGESYSIGTSTDGESSSTSAGGSSGPREQTLSMSSALFTGSRSSSNGTSTSITAIDLTGRYGWNKGIMEYGPLAEFEYASASSVSTRTIEVGGFFDYNLVENKEGVDMVYGLGATASIGQSSTEGQPSTSIMNINGGGQLKWFPFGHATAIRLDAGLNYERQSVSGRTLTTTGLLIAAGLQTYF